jgi:hypothetical protein
LLEQKVAQKMNYPAAEQRGIKNSIAHAKLRRRAAGNPETSSGQEKP